MDINNFYETFYFLKNIPNIDQIFFETKPKKFILHKDYSWTINNFLDSKSEMDLLENNIKWNMDLYHVSYRWYWPGFLYYLGRIDPDTDTGLWHYRFLNRWSPLRQKTRLYLRKTLFFNEIWNEHDFWFDSRDKPFFPFFDKKQLNLISFFNTRGAVPFLEDKKAPITNSNFYFWIPTRVFIPDYVDKKSYILNISKSINNIFKQKFNISFFALDQYNQRGVFNSGIFNPFRDKYTKKKKI